jgi:hypothetical protein
MSQRPVEWRNVSRGFGSARHRITAGAIGSQAEQKRTTNLSVGRKV